MPFKNDFDIERSIEPPDEPEMIDGYEIEKEKLFKALLDAIGLYQENVTQHDMSHNDAKTAAALEVMDGIDYDTPNWSRYA